MKIATWNVNGIRAREAQLLEWLADEQPDVLCLQEIKASLAQVPGALAALDDYWNLWHGGAGGYSGVSLHLRKERFAGEPVFEHPPFDMETRMVQAEVDGIVFASVYIPNGGKDYAAKLAFLRHMADYVAEIHDSGRRLVLCGDMNITREDRDVHPSQFKPGMIGARPDERALFEQMIAHDLVDVARTLDPDNDRLFTWWPFWRAARQRNLGWRLDYVFVSAPIARAARESHVRREVGTSDHGPVVVLLDDAKL
jgi:exodeoxyribonuclease III